MKFAIHIMSHNNHELLNTCIQRIKAYTNIPYDLVITDDASEPAYNIEGATIVRMPKQSNCCNLRNVGMEMAKADWVFWLDNDTMVNQGWYEPFIDCIDDETVGMVGSPKDSRLIRKPFLPLTQAECMTEMQFAMDFNHYNHEADFITSYCILVRKKAFRPTYCYNMPTPVLDPELGAMIKVQGYKVIVSGKDAAVNHGGTSTARPGGLNYHYFLSRNFTRWWNFWEPHKEKVFELYRGIPVEYDHNRYEPARTGARSNPDMRDVDFDVIPNEYHYEEP